MISRSSAILFVLAVGAVCAAVGFGAPWVLRLAEPGRLWLCVVPLAMSVAFVSWRLWRVRVAQQLGVVATVQSMAGPVSARRVWNGAVATIGAALLLVIAIARPQWGERVREVERSGIDIVFAVDLSRSMWAEDVVPSRLRATQSEITRLMRGLGGDRIGLVVFAADAVIQSPLTSDHGAITHYLNRVSPDDFSRQGTAIGRAITSATDLLTGRFAPDFDRAGTQIIVVFSDGEDTISDPVAAATAANEAGIRVYTVGVGTPEGGQIPLRNPDGTLRGWLTDRQGQNVVTRLVEEQMRATSEAGGGEYLRLEQEGGVAQALQYAIGEFDAENLSSVLRAEYEDRYAFFAVPALLLLWAVSLIGDRRRRLPNRPITPALVVLIGLIAGCDRLPDRTDPRVDRAIEEFAAGQTAAAREALEAAHPEARVQPNWEYDYGRVEEFDAQLEAAQERYLRAIAADDPVDQARALFALGNVLLERDRLNEAVERYRRVLELDPAHDGARRNLEIALRRLYPACETLDDTVEPNDEAGAATPLPKNAFTGSFVPPEVPEGSGEGAPVFTACPGDADWYVMPAIGGSTIDVTVHFERLRADNGGARLPDRVAPTSMRIAVLGHDGVTPLGVDQGLAEIGEDGLVAAADVTRTLEGLVVDPGLGNDSQTYLKVEVDDPLEYTYTIEVEVTPPCWALEDEFESNDLPTTARAMADGEHAARLCGGNADWYLFDVPADHDLFVDVSAPQSDTGSALASEVAWFIDQTERAQQQGTLDETTPSASFSVRSPGAAPRRAWLRITSVGESEGSYSLTVYDYAPCPDDDRFEPNDQPEQATAIGQDPPPPYAHLRMCAGNSDWFNYTLPPPPEPDQDEGSGAAPQPRPFSVLVTSPDAGAALTVRLYDPTTGRVLSESTPLEIALEGSGTSVEPQAAPAQAVAGSAPEAPAPLTPALPRAGALAATTLDPAVQSVIVVVEGAAAFYDLEFPDTQNQQQQQQQQDNQQSDGDPQDPQDGQDGEPQEQEPDDGTGEQQPSEPDEGTGQEPQPTDPQEGTGEPQDPLAAEASEEEQRQELLRLLESLEDRDTNLQIQQTLQNLPPAAYEQQW